MMSRPYRWAAALLATAFVLGACGSDQMTLGEYASTVEDLVWDMNLELDALDAARTQDSVESERRYLDGRLVARQTFRDELSALTAPDAAQEVHEGALDVIGRLIDAERGLVDAAAAAETMDDLNAMWNGEPGRAWQQVDDEAVAFCQAAEAEFATEEEATLAGVPWVPPEMKETIWVALGCSAEERGSG
jgi:hypothetical protein